VRLICAHYCSLHFIVTFCLQDASSQILRNDVQTRSNAHTLSSVVCINVRCVGTTNWNDVCRIAYCSIQRSCWANYACLIESKNVVWLTLSLSSVLCTKVLANMSIHVQSVRLTVLNCAVEEWLINTSYKAFSLTLSVSWISWQAITSISTRIVHRGKSH